jgi:hypothetical protein
MAVLYPWPKNQFFDTNGNPLNSGKLYTYVAGSSTPALTYTDSAAGTQNDNPVVLNSRGEANVWFDGSKLYKLVLKTSADVEVWTVDNVGLDASGMYFLQSGSGAVARTARAKIRETVSVTDFGAVGDGTTDDTTALNAAFAMTGRLVLLPKGNYKVTANLAEPVCAGIVGEGPKDSKITAATGVTTVISLATAASASFRRMEDFAVHGNATTNARGMILGNGALYAGLSMRNVNVEDFTGTTAIGIYYRDIVGLVAENVRVSGCTENEVFQKSAVSGCPTTLYFKGGASRAALGIGSRIREGNDVVFDGRVFEANTNEGWKVYPQGSENAIGIVFRDCWHESNWPSDSTQYDGVVDGSLGTPYVSVVGRGSTFNSSCRSLRFTGANVRSEVIRVVPRSAANAVVIDTNAIVEQDWPTAWDLTQYLTNSTGLLHDTKGQVWESWTPVLTFATVGNLSVSYSVQLGRITRSGRKVTAEYAITTSAFTHTTASGNLKITGLTVAGKTLSNIVQYGTGTFQGITAASYTQIVPVITSGVSEIVFHAAGSGQNLIPVTATEVPTGGSVILRGQITYEI